MHAPPLLKKMVAYEASIKSNITWGALIISDLKYIRSLCPFLDHFPDPSDDICVWHHFINDCPADFSRVIERVLFEYPDHTDVYNLPPVPKAKPVLPKPFQCGICSDVFTSHQEAAAHRFKKHGVKSPLRSKIQDTHCYYCLKEFHTRTKVHNHVAYRSKFCMSYYEHAIDFCDPEIISKLESDETARVKTIVAKGHSKLYSPFPCGRVVGPVPPPPISVSTHFLHI